MTIRDSIRWLKFLSKSNLPDTDKAALNLAIHKLQILENLESELDLIPCKCEDDCSRQSCYNCNSKLIAPEDIIDLFK